MTPKQKLEAAARAISTAATLLNMEMPTMVAFLKECHDMENFGHLIDPTLYGNSERKAVAALLEPLFEAARNFTVAYDRHTADAKAALEKVSAT